MSLRRALRETLAAAALACMALSGAGWAGTCTDDASSAAPSVYRVCMPDPFPGWNGDLVVFAHGYVAPGDPVAIPEGQLVLPDGTSIPALVTGLGYAFATTSYPENGLVIPEAVGDIVHLVHYFTTSQGQPRRVLLVGASEGGLATALAVEQYPEVFAGGLATCGPVGDFRSQLNHVGDFRVVFDYFFPRLLPGSPVSVPAELMANWETNYAPLIATAIATRPHATEQLLRVTRAPVDPADPASAAETVLGILWYNVFATNDAIARLGGQPYDNSRRLYLGSDNDFLLNLVVPRFRANPLALAAIQSGFLTSGRLSSPLVTVHTTGDPIVPYGQEPLYTLKTILAGSARRHVELPVFRYGHCNFEADEVLTAFKLLAYLAGR
ncbi:MAG: prolyl oligopeptidase family serine peptidase [Deltaproteobacteria bacterium]|nr:prolyl oligopeptidase family serine peptidase [Deltaproteobacteria bacterium]